MRIYLAAPLFNEQERAYNRKIAEILQGNGHTVFLPQSLGLIDDEQVSEIFFDQECIEIVRCDVVLAIYDGVVADPGTCWEVGYAFGIDTPVVYLHNDARQFSKHGLNNMLVHSGKKVSYEELCSDKWWIGLDDSGEVRS